MGNCFNKHGRFAAEIQPMNVVKGTPIVKLYGSSSSPVACLIRLALRYKTIPLQYIPLENPNLGTDSVILQCGTETVTGAYESIVRFIDSRFPNPPLVTCINQIQVRESMPVIVVATTLQHKSMMWHLDGLIYWAEDLKMRHRRGVQRPVDPSMGSPRMEVKKFARTYSQLLEIMLEHAQMEERIIFPVLERADRGLCSCANHQHARDLPIMNGIKEDVKAIGVLETGSPDYEEAMSNLSFRLKTLQKHCKEHFEEEEQELLPLLEAAELSRVRQEAVLEQCFEMMEGTHFHQFNFLLAGLQPQDAMLYLDMVTRCRNREMVIAMLRPLMSRTEENPIKR